MTVAAQVTNAPQATDFSELKAKQQAAWSAGDYCVVGSTLQVVGEVLCEALDTRSGGQLIDVAAGNGNISLAAARRGAAVTSTDYAPSLLKRGQARAEAEGFSIAFEEADAENLPFADGAFDVVTSTFGVMFTPDHERAAAEMARVCRAGGRIGLANWTPESFIGRLFKVLGGYIPPAPGLRSPALWGTREHLEQLFGDEAASISITERDFKLRYRSAQDWLETWRTYYGPMQKAFGTLHDLAAAGLARDLIALAEEFNIAEDRTMVVPSRYLEVVIKKS